MLGRKIKDQTKTLKEKVMIFNETVVTAIASVVLGALGKEFWSYWKNRDVIKGQVDTLKKISEMEKKHTKKIQELEDEIHELETQREKTNTAIKMMLTIFEGEYGKDPMYKSVIAELKKYLKPPKGK